MKTKVVIQCNGVDTAVEDIEKAVKEELKANGVKVSKVKTLDVYFQPTENKTYYVAVDENDQEVTGKL